MRHPITAGIRRCVRWLSRETHEEGPAENSTNQHHSDDNHSNESSERLTVTIAEAADRLGIGRSLCYELARQGELPTIRLGRRVLVPLKALEALIDGEEQSERKDPQ